VEDLSRVRATLYELLKRLIKSKTGRPYYYYYYNIFPGYLFLASCNIILCAQPSRYMTTLMTIQTQEQDETDLAKQAVEDIEAFAERYRRNLTRV
jgi:hypothetical protein